MERSDGKDGEFVTRAHEVLRFVCHLFPWKRFFVLSRSKVFFPKERKERKEDEREEQRNYLFHGYNRPHDMSLDEISLGEISCRESPVGEAVVTRRWKRKSFVIAGKSSPVVKQPLRPVGEDLTARTNFDFLFYLLLSRRLLTH